MTETAKIPVSGYERGDGVKVGEHERAAPLREKRPLAEGDNGDNDNNNKNGVAPTGGEAPEKKRNVTVQELIEMDLKEFQARVLESDAEKLALMESDNAARAHKDEQDAQDMAPHAELNAATDALQAQHASKMDLLDKLESAREDLYAQGSHNSNLDGIITNARAGRYDTEGGQYGMRSLVPHLQSAGLFALAKEVGEGKYVF